MRNSTTFSRVYVIASLACATGFVASPRCAQAQQPGNEARALYDRGLEAMDDSRFADAIVAFEQSYEKRAMPVVLYNLALAYRGAGRTRDAITTFERYLSTGTNIPRDEVTTVRAEVVRLRATLSTIVLTAEPSTALLQVDGRVETLVDGGYTIEHGRHIVEVVAEGYTSQQRAVTLAEGERYPLAVQLVRAGGPGKLHVEITVSAATVTVDGHIWDVEQREQALAPGHHNVVIRAVGYETYTRDVLIGQTGVMRLDVNMVRPGPAGWVIPVSIVGGAVLAGGVGLLVWGLSGETLPMGLWAPGRIQVPSP